MRRPPGLPSAPHRRSGDLRTGPSARAPGQGRPAVNGGGPPRPGPGVKGVRASAPRGLGATTMLGGLSTAGGARGGAAGGARGWRRAGRPPAESPAGPGASRGAPAGGAGGRRARGPATGANGSVRARTRGPVAAPREAGHVRLRPYICMQRPPITSSDKGSLHAEMRPRPHFPPVVRRMGPRGGRRRARGPGHGTIWPTVT